MQLPPLARRSAALGSDSAFDLLAAVNRLRDEGRDVISFGIGEPDIDTPGLIIDAAKAALDQQRTRYGPSDGLPELRAAIAEHVSATRGIQVEPNQVVVAPGGKAVMVTNYSFTFKDNNEAQNNSAFTALRYCL